MNSPRWNTRRGANLPHTPGISRLRQRSWFILAFFVDRGLVVRWRQPRSTLFLMEGAKVVISSRMQVMKQQGAASQEGVR